jgi:DNA helicase-2/ATP-dependent DNA helicase PcrA
VGDSEQIHGYSDEFLAANGKNAIDVFTEFLEFIQDAFLVGHNLFTEFLEFIQDAFLVGHNLGFDIKMIVRLNRIRFERR